MSVLRTAAILGAALLLAAGLAACCGDARSDGSAGREQMEVMLLPGSNLVPVVTVQD